MKDLTPRQMIGAMTETLQEIAAKYGAGELSPLSGVAIGLPEKPRPADPGKARKAGTA